MMDHLVIGLLPQPYWELIANIFLLPIFRLIGVAHILYFDNIVLDEYTKKTAAKQD